MASPASKTLLSVNSGWAATDLRWFFLFSNQASSQSAGVALRRVLTVYLRGQGWLAGIGGFLAAELSGVGGQVLDVGVGEVGGLDPAGDAGLGQQPGHPAGERVDRSGGVALPGP